MRNCLVIAHAVATDPTPVTRGMISLPSNENPSGIICIPGIIFKVSASEDVAVTNKILRGMILRKYRLTK